MLETMITDKQLEVKDCLIADGNLGNFSDGYHTFNELYHHRAVLFSVICSVFRDKVMKSKVYDNGDMFDSMFTVDVGTQYGHDIYHYDIEPFLDAFNVMELEETPKWDGYTPDDAIRKDYIISKIIKQLER